MSSQSAASKQHSPIEHIVVLMMENRSFDHMLGFLPREGHLARMEGLTGKEFNLLDPADPTSQRFYVQEGAIYEFWGHTIGGGPAHSFHAANIQLCASGDGPSEQHPALANGFVKSYAGALQAWLQSNGPRDEHGHPLRTAANSDELKLVMQAFAPEQVPVISTLAREFCLCDHWFSSVPGPTMANRLYAHAATSQGFVHNVWEHEFDFRTIYNSLEDAGRSWGIYSSNDNMAQNFVQLRSHQQERSLHRSLHADFFADVDADQLPDYSFLIPNFISLADGPDEGYRAANTQHAPTNVWEGERLMARVYNALRAQEDVWRKTLLVLVYDEHGGFFDHVVPPTGVPNPDGLTSPRPDDDKWVPPFDFQRLGFRVPAILISPWVRRGLCKTHFEHASIPATVKNFFGLPDFLTERDRAANTFEHLLTGAAGFREDTPFRLEPAPHHQACDLDALMQRQLDDTQLDQMRGTIAKEPDADKRTQWLERLESGMTQGEAAEIVRRVMDDFMERRRQLDGAHPSTIE